MTDCRIYRRASRSVWVSVDGGRQTARLGREWVARCPHCGETIRWSRSYPYYASPTRKNVKDALHRHVTEKHS